MNLLIYEPDHVGHHFNYVRLLIEALRSFDVSVTLVTYSEAPQTEEFQAQLQALLPHFRCEAVLEAGSGRGDISDPSMFLETLKRFSPDHVYVPYVDVLAQNLGILRLQGRLNWPEQMEVEALMMRGGFAYPPPDLRYRIKSRISWRLATAVPWTVLHHLDPLVFVALKRRGKSIPPHLKLMPDPVEPIPLLTKVEARRRLGLPLEGRYIGCVGALSERKGIGHLVRAFVKLPRDNDDKLLLAGKQNHDVIELIKDAKSRLGAKKIIDINRFLSNEEVDTIMSALDVVCVPYPSHIGSASFVIRAVVAERPVLSTDYGWSGFVVPEFELGARCNVLDEDVFAKAIIQALRAADDYKLSDKAMQFHNFHTPENFAGHWTRRLRERLGMAPPPIDEKWPLE